MVFETKFNIGDFVSYGLKFGVVTDIRIYSGRNSPISIKYMLNISDGRWIAEGHIFASSQEEAAQYYQNKIMTTTDDMY